ncbi:hypothetical protein [Stenotrophomonas geniculata]
MKELTSDEVNEISGGNPLMWVSLVYTAFSISDSVHAFAEGYTEARNSR